MSQYRKYIVHPIFVISLLKVRHNIQINMWRSCGVVFLFVPIFAVYLRRQMSLLKYIEKKIANPRNVCNSILDAFLEIQVKIRQIGRVISF